jgi:hypothetical protein
MEEKSVEPSTNQGFAAQCRKRKIGRNIGYKIGLFVA